MCHVVAGVPVFARLAADADADSRLLLPMAYSSDKKSRPAARTLRGRTWPRPAEWRTSHRSADERTPAAAAAAASAAAAALPPASSDMGCGGDQWHAGQQHGQNMAQPLPQGISSSLAASASPASNGGGKGAGKGGRPGSAFSSQAAPRGCYDLYLLNVRTLTWSQLPRTLRCGARRGHLYHWETVPARFWWVHWAGSGMKAAHGRFDRGQAGPQYGVAETYGITGSGRGGSAKRSGGGVSSIVGGNAAARQLPWSDALHALHLPTLQWFTLAAPGPMPSPRYGHAAAIVDGAATVASRTLVRGGGLTKAVAGSPAEVQLTACDARGQPKWAGGDSFEVTLVGESGGDAAGTTLNAHVTDNLDGTYAAQYFPSRAGAYKLVVSLVHHAGALEGFGAGFAPAAMLTSLRHLDAAKRPVHQWQRRHWRAAGAHGATMATMGTTREQVGGSHCVKVSPGAAYALRATLPSAWAIAGEEFGPIELSLVDSLGNVLAQRLSTPPLVEMRVAAPLRAASGDTPRLPSSGKCVCEIAKFEASSAGHGACRGGARMWLKLKGDAARVTLVLSAPCAGQHLDNESTPAKAIGNESAEEAAGQLLPAELLIHLTGAARQLCASVASRGAVCDQIYGPIKVVAADEYGNAVGCAPDSPHFEPAVTVRRRKLASDSGPSSPTRGGRGGAATDEDQRELITCEIARTLWQRSGSAGCPMALVWLMLRGSSGEIVLQVTDGLGRVPCSASVPIYLTGPPFSLRASYDVEWHLRVRRGERAADRAAGRCAR